MIKVLSFRIADELFGVDITHVKEINRNVEYTAIPRAPDNIVGLFNMRGQIVTLFSLAKIMGYDMESSEGKVTCIILKSAANDANQVGFVIEKTGDVIDLEEEMCEATPANVDGQDYKYISMVARLENELLMVIDPQKIFRS